MKKIYFFGLVGLATIAVLVSLRWEKTGQKTGRIRGMAGATFAGNVRDDDNIGWDID